MLIYFEFRLDKNVLLENSATCNDRSILSTRNCVYKTKKFITHHRKTIKTSLRNILVLYCIVYAIVYSYYLTK